MPKKEKPKGDRKEGQGGEQQGGSVKEPSTARGLIRKAYRKLSQRMETSSGNGESIEDLSKLVKIEKEIVGEQKGAKGVKKIHTWDPGNKSSG